MNNQFKIIMIISFLAYVKGSIIRLKSEPLDPPAIPDSTIESDTTLYYTSTIETDTISSTHHDTKQMHHKKKLTSYDVNEASSHFLCMENETSRITQYSISNKNRFICYEKYIEIVFEKKVSKAFLTDKIGCLSFEQKFSKSCPRIKRFNLISLCNHFHKLALKKIKILCK